MELEEMKGLWEEMSRKVEKQQLVTDQLIMEMTQQKYTNKFSKLMAYEMTGAVICFIMGVFILFNIEKMDTWYLMLCGGLTVAFLLIVPVIVLRLLGQMKRLKLSKNNFKETLLKFEKAKKQTLLIQKGATAFSIMFMLLVIPVFQKIFNNKDFFQTEQPVGYWIFLVVMAIGVGLFARWGYSCYKSVTNSAENILKELDE